MCKALFCFMLIFQIHILALAGDTITSTVSTRVLYNTVSNTIEITDAELGTVLYNGIVELQDLSGHFAVVDFNMPGVAESNDCMGEINLSSPSRVKIRALCNKDSTITVVVEAADDSLIRFRAYATAVDAISAIPQNQRATDCNIIFTTMGNANLYSDTLFDTRADMLVSAQSPAGAFWKWNNGWQLQTGTAQHKLEIKIQIKQHYYRDELGLGYFVPLQKTSFWHTAPVVALTWYGISTYGGDSKQKKEWLYPQIDFVAQNLLPYAGKMVFQLDDNYYFNDDKYMRDISDYIRSKGMIPGIWLTPFSLATPETAQSHPDWFLHDSQGKLLTNFGGCNWGYLEGQQTYVLNIHNIDAVRQWYGMFWHKVSNTWNYDYFKLDAAPNALHAYSTSLEGGGPFGYRKGLQIARDIIGPDKFINNCTGPLPASFGLIQGTRTGVDTAPYDHAVDVIQRWNFLNNIVLWCDADAIANSYQKTTELIHLNVTARALTGQQFLTDDMWTRMPAPARLAMQKAIPTLDIYPANLYRIENWRDYEIFDLKIARDWGNWDVAALFNYTGLPSVKTLDLSKLRLSSERVHVFEYWSSKYIGQFDRNMTITRYLLPYDAEVFAIVPVIDNRPVILSTSRHISQGAIDLAAINCSGNANKWTFLGKSTNLVTGEDYELVFAALNFEAVDVNTEVTHKIISNNGIVRVRLTPTSSTAFWQITFMPLTKTALSFSPEQVCLVPGESTQFEITNLGPHATRWKITSSDSRIRISPEQGALASWPAAEKFVALVDANGFDQPDNYDFTIAAQDVNNSQCCSSIVVPVIAKNLACKAQVIASSFNAGHDPNLAIDSDSHTAWYSTTQDKNGAWIELKWDKPVTIGRVVLDECTAQFKQILAWHLEIEQGNSMKNVKSGTILERRMTVQLNSPCITKRVRFVIDKATNMPGLWEFQAFEK